MRRAIILLIAAVALVAGPLPGQPARAAATYTYDIDTRGDVQSDVSQFAELAAATLADSRGWSLGGSIDYVRDESGAETDFTLWLAEPDQMESFSNACDSMWSCRVGDDVIINDRRWREGASEWPYNIHEYRHYVVTHEMGHWLGLGHDECPAPGEPAPVMMQESKGTNGCVGRVWPLPRERADVAQRHRSAVLYDDGYADVLWYESWNDHGLTAAESTGDSYRPLGQWLSGWATPDRVLVGDVNSDGLSDLLWYERWNDRSITVALSTGSGYRAGGRWLSGWDPDRAWTGDLDNDGDDDLIWYDADDGQIDVALSDGQRFIDQGAWLSGYGSPDWADMGDVDRDGDADLLWYERWKDGSVTVALSTRSSFQTDGAWVRYWGPPTLAWARDAEGDSRADLVWYENWKEGGTVTVALSDGGHFAHDGAWVSGWGTPDRAFVDDVNGDARTDINWYERWNDHGITVAVSTGDGFASRGQWLTGWGNPTRAALDHATR